MIIGMIKAHPMRNRMPKRAEVLPSGMGQGGSILPP